MKSIKEQVAELKLKDEAAKRLEKAGIPKIKQPKTELVLDFPDDVSRIPPNDLGRYMAVYESEAGWISYCIARREIDLEHAKILLTFVYNRLLEDLLGNKPTEMKIKVEADSFYLSCKLEVKEIDSDLKLLRASLSTMERYAKAISREITNRKMTYENFPSSRIDDTGGKIFGGGDA